MKVPKNKLNITNTFEVKMRQEMWSSILHYAHSKQITFSWVSRFCIFTLLSKYRKFNNKIEIVNIKEKENLKKDVKFNTKMHRHNMCLYGDDAIHIRIIAHKLGLTISQIVRISILLFIHLLSTSQSSLNWSLSGLKHIEKLYDNNKGFIKKPFTPDKYKKFSRCYKKYWGWIYT